MWLALSRYGRKINTLSPAPCVLPRYCNVIQQLKIQNQSSTRLVVYSQLTETGRSYSDFKSGVAEKYVRVAQVRQ